MTEIETLPKKIISSSKEEGGERERGRKFQDPLSIIFRANFNPMIFDFIKPAALLAMDRGLLWVEDVGEADGGGGAGRGGGGDDDDDGGVDVMREREETEEVVEIPEEEVWW